MSMCLYLKHASEIDLARYVKNGVEEDDLETPLNDFGGAGAMDGLILASLEATEKWMLETLKTPMDAARREQVSAALEQLKAQIAAMRGAASGVKKPVAGQKSPVLDLHKSWHMLHFLFTGQAWDGEMPASALLLGGREVGEDMGYGPARALTPAETESFAGFLKGLEVSKLAQRLDADKMQKLEIYSASDDDGELEEDLEHYFPQLQSFVTDAANKRQGLLIYMM